MENVYDQHLRLSKHPICSLHVSENIEIAQFGTTVAIDRHPALSRVVCRDAPAASHRTRKNRNDGDSDAVLLLIATLV